MTTTNFEAVLKAIGDLSEDGFFLYSVLHRQFDYANNALLKIFEISDKSEILETEFFKEVIIAEDLNYLQSEYQHIFTSHRIENVEFRIRAHDGEAKDVVCSAYLIDDDRYIVGFVKDFTLVREHEDYIINYGAKKDALLEMVNHNLSGPLAISKNIIASLEHSLRDQNNNNLNTHIKLIKENTSHCIDLVNDFLKEEHLVSEKIYTRKKRFEISEKIETVVDRFGKSYPDFKFRLTKNFDRLYINNDDVKFLQVVNNLISNAIKWSEEGKEIAVHLIESEDGISTIVKDRGIGIPDDLKATIFEKYSPARREGLRGERSTGMGLYIVDKLVTLMEGTISFESRENEGTAFSVMLPKERKE